MTVKELRDRLDAIIAMGIIEGQEYLGPTEGFKVVTKQVHHDSGYYGAVDDQEVDATDVLVQDFLDEVQIV